jgi:hypothetical protein
MATQSQAPTLPESAHKVLGSKGAKLHTHEFNIRHADNGGYITRHELRDKNGNHPADGQKSAMEMQHPDMAALQEAVAQHMQQNAQGQPMPPGGEPDADDTEG